MTKKNFNQEKASAEKFPGGPTEKRPKNNKKTKKVALLKLFQEGSTEKKTEK